MLASVDVAVWQWAVFWQWVATGAVGVSCVLLGWLLRSFRERLTRAEVSFADLRKRTEVIDRKCAVMEAAVSNGLSESIDGLQTDVRELHRKIESSCSELGGKIDNVMGHLLDWAQSVAVQVKKG